MKRSILYDLEIRHGAKMVEKAGMLLPKVFSNVNIETNAVKEKCVMFDMADKAKIFIEGEDAYNFILSISSAKITSEKWKIQRTLFLYNNGKILDIANVYFFNKSFIMLVVGINSFSSTLAFLLSLVGNKKVTITDKCDDFHRVDIVGKLSREVIEKNLEIDLKNLRKNTFMYFDSNNEKVIVFHEDILGRTYGIIASNDFINHVYKELANNPVVLLGGIDSYNDLRKKALCLEYGIDIDGTNNPYEAGLEGLIDFSHDFYGKKELLKIKGEKLKRKIVGLEITSKNIESKRNKVIINGIVIGYVTSVSNDMNNNISYGLAIVDADYLKTKEDIYVESGDEKIKAYFIL